MRIRILALWHRVKVPALCIALGVAIWPVWSVARHLYIDHQNMHTLFGWAQRIDREMHPPAKAGAVK